MSTHTYIYNRLTAPMLRLALLLMMIIGGMTKVWGQEKRIWDFTKWSEQTVENLKIDAAASTASGWSDDEKGDGSNMDATAGNCFWAITTPNENGELSANGIVIEELKGLNFVSDYTNSRSLAIAVNYPSTDLGNYQGGAYLWLGNNNNVNTCFVIPSVKGGSIIRMGVESHRLTDPRGVELFINGTKIDGPSLPTTFEVQTWTVPDYYGTVDITVNNTNGCHIYFIEVSPQETLDEIVVGQSQLWFRNNDFADQIGDLGNGDFTYSSSDINVITFETGTNAGIATIQNSGTAIVTVTKNGALKGSYKVRVKRDTWDFASISTGYSKTFSDYDSWSDVIPATSELTFKGSWTTGSNSGKNAVKTSTGVEHIKIPAIAGQLVEFGVSKMGTGGSYNHNLTDEGLEDKQGPNINNGSFRIAGSNAIQTFTAKVSNGRTDFIIGVDDTNNGKDDYFHSIKTYFPTNDISFDENEYSVSYLPNSFQAGQLATTANSSNNVYYESLNQSIATVHPFTGEVITKQPGTTVKIRAYNLGEIGKYNGDKSTYAEYSLKIESREKLITDINIEDLLYKDAVIADNDALNRTIPYFDIIVDGGILGQAAQSDGTNGLRLKYLNGATGKLTIKPRYVEISSAEISFSSVTVTFATAPVAGEMLNVNGQLFTLTDDLVQTFDNLTGTEITLEYCSYGDGVVIGSVHVYGVSSDNSAVSDMIMHEKTKPQIQYDFVGDAYSIPIGSKLPLEAFASSCNFRSVVYTLTDNDNGIFSIEDGYVCANKNGSAKLNSTFYGSKYFASTEDVTVWNLTAVQSDYKVELNISNKIKVDRTPSIDGFAFNNITLDPVLTINGEEVNQDVYSVVYTTNNTRLAYVDAAGNLVTYPKAEGLVTITATITSKYNLSMPILAAHFNLMVLSGEWNFYTYNNTHQGNLKTQGSNNGIYDNDHDVWATSSSNNRVRARETDDFEYILQGGGNENEPLDIARALQTRYSVRWFHADNNISYLHLFGSYNTKNGYGGILKIPAQIGMVIDIWASSDSENAEMLINTSGKHTDTKKNYSAVSDLDGTAVTYFYLNPVEDGDLGTEDKYKYRYIVNQTDENGFIYIINPSYNLYLYLRKIKLSTEIVFKDGTDVYVDGEKGERVENSILNSSNEDRFSYAISNKTVDFSNESITISSEGDIQLDANKYGMFTVSVQGEGSGRLAGVNGSYTVHAIDMAVTKQVQATASDDLEWNADVLKSWITRLSYGTGNEAQSLDNAVRDMVEFSEVSHTPNIRRVIFTGKTGNQTLSIEGIGDVVIRAKLGNVVREITITITGVALSDRSPVCSNSDTSVQFTVNVSDATNFIIEYDAEEMLNNMLGDLRNYRNPGQADELKLTYDEETRTFTLYRADGSQFAHGGAMPIKLKCNDTELIGMLTVAYTSHDWHFDRNMLLYNHSEFSGIYKFYTDKENKSRVGEWTDKSTFGNPAGGEGIGEEWRFVHKIGNHPETDLIYYYTHSIDGDNAMILPETAGLIINSDETSQQFGVQMMSTRDEKDNNKAKPNIVDLDTDFNGIADAKGYDMQNVMLRLGGELIVPYVQPGQWIEMRWYRHTPDRGERLTLSNLYDVEGKEIDDTYKIGNTENGTYMFQVDPTSTEKWLNAIFHITDYIYIQIQEVILHEPGWEYISSMNRTLKQVIGQHEVDGKIVQDYSEVNYQYITGTVGPIKLANHGQQNAPTAPYDWQITAKGTLDFNIEGFDENKVDEMYCTNDDGPIITVNDGWGKMYITLNSYTSDNKFVANRNTWIITFGVPPVQTYPYTWDFTKFLENTKKKISDDKFSDEDKGYDAETNPTGSHELRIDINTWNKSDDEAEETVITADYDSVKYGSFYVDGAQLVSYGLKDNAYNGCLPETAGLGFRVKNLGDKINDNVGILQLDMQSIVDGTETGSDDGKEKDGATWRSGKLAIRGGGSIIVPRPILEVDGETEPQKRAQDYYIYIKSSVEPDVVVNAMKMNDDVDNSMGMYKYRFATDREMADSKDADSEETTIEENGNARFDFNGDADVYVIAVTDMLKTMTALSGTSQNEKTGWATESREMAIDHTLTGYLTVNPTKAYAVVEAEDNPIYSDSKRQTIVALKDQRYVVPENYGLVLKQTENVLKNINEKYKVPLFVPAITTKVDDIDKGEYNLMRPYTTTAWPKDVDGPGKPFTSETEEVEDNDADARDYTRFILTSRYMTWRRQDEGGKEGEVTKPKEYDEGTVAAFYRLHVFDESVVDNAVEKDATTLNSLPLNSAYLLLKTNEINDALWNESKPSDSNMARRLYIGIEGVSDMTSGEDMDSLESPDVIDASVAQPMEIFNLRGQKLNPNSQLAPGIYIKNGRKIYIK